jgi:hypothetical protein
MNNKKYVKYNCRKIKQISRVLSALSSPYGLYKRNAPFPEITITSPSESSGKEPSKQVQLTESRQRERCSISKAFLDMFYVAFRVPSSPSRFLKFYRQRHSAYREQFNLPLKVLDKMSPLPRTPKKSTLRELLST